MAIYHLTFIRKALNHVHGCFKVLFTIERETTRSLQSKDESTVADPGSGGRPPALTGWDEMER